MKRFLAVLVLGIFLAGVGFATVPPAPPDMGPDFYDWGFARGDLLNYKFHQLASYITDVFLISSGSIMIPASPPARVHFDMAPGATVASWSNASMTYESGVDNLSVWVDGVYQEPLYNWTETATSAITFTFPMPFGVRVAVLRNMFFEAGTPAVTPARVRVAVAASTTISWPVWQMTYTMGDDRLVVFADGLYQDESNFTEIASNSIDVPGIVGIVQYIDLLRLY